MYAKLPVPEFPRLVRWFVASLLLTSFVGWTGCDDTGSGWATAEQLSVNGCEEQGAVDVFEPFRLDLTFLGLVPMQGTAFIRLSEIARDAADGDQLLILLHDLDEVLEQLSATGEASLEVGEQTGQFSLALTLHERCSANHDPLHASAGSLTLTKLGTKPGSRVTGTLEVTIHNARTGVTATESLEAGFDLLVVTTTPQQPFSVLPEHRVP